MNLPRPARDRRPAQQANISFGSLELKTAHITLLAAGRLVVLDWPRPGLKLGQGQAYLADFLERRKQQPRQDDIIDAVLYFEFPDGTPYTDADRAASLTQIVAAGARTTGAVISGAIYHLATHPADRRQLQADFFVNPRAVEEFLRVYVSAPNNGRRVIKDVEIAGTQLREPYGDAKGDYIIYNLGGTNRGPSVFECPEKGRYRPGSQSASQFRQGTPSLHGAAFGSLEPQIRHRNFSHAHP